jgi:hypothetical protein
MITLAWVGLHSIGCFGVCSLGNHFVTNVGKWLSLHRNLRLIYIDQIT